MFQLTFHHFESLMTSGVLEKDNHERCIRIFYDAAKIVHYRQKRLDKPQLKMNQISSALLLADFYHSSMFRFLSTGPLACNFPDCPEDKAVTYFADSMMGTVSDVYGRKIEIQDDGLRSLYKDRHTGKHAVAPENYEQVRGKRLPWINHTLGNTRSIYQNDSRVQGHVHRSYLYTALASIRLAAGMVHIYFIVVVSENANGLLRFITAYPVDNHNRFLKRIEECTPFSPR